MAKKAMKLKQQKNSQVFYTRLYPLQDLRKTPRIPEKVRHLPCMLP